jgi:hypothetical protein
MRKSSYCRVGFEEKKLGRGLNQNSFILHEVNDYYPIKMIR